MVWGLRISKPDINVVTATDPRDFLFNSDYNTLKLYKWGNASFTTDGSGNATATIAHNLSYAPAFYVWRKDTASWNTLDNGNSYTNAFLPLGGPNYWASDDLHHALHAYADTTNLYIRAAGAQPSTTMNFRYYILVDLSQDFSSGSGASPRDFAFRVSNPNVDVLTAEEYQLQYSSDYKALEYHEVSRKTSSITLPVMFASAVDEFVEEGSYVDFNHGLGYAPFFLANFESSISQSSQIPYALPDALDEWNYSVTGFSDATRVRLSFWRASRYNSVSGSVLGNWAQETITLRVHIFTENLAGGSSP